jgi:hypothetical protein
MYQGSSFKVGQEVTTLITQKLRAEQFECDIRLRDYRYYQLSLRKYLIRVALTSRGSVRRCNSIHYKLT